MNDIVQEKLRMEKGEKKKTKYCGIVFPQIEPSLYNQFTSVKSIISVLRN